jgi:predicted ATPase
MTHLRSLSLRPWPETDDNQYPFHLPLLQTLPELDFSAPVTFFVGENGSGKSTLLEAIAIAAGSVTVGSEAVRTDKTLAPVRKFSEYLHLVWNKRTHKGFFLRAEDFFGYARKMVQTRQEMQADLQNVDVEYKERSKLAADLARMPYQRELGDMRRKYEGGLENFSHGESFLKLFQARFVPGGLYLLDEPEVPLSPVRQMALISALKEMTVQNSQFIIATHSPILMAFPEAVIYSFDETPIKSVKYDELEHVTLTRAFLQDPEAFINRL